MFVGNACHACPATAQSRSEKKAQTERNVREAINADHYKINVDYMTTHERSQPRPDIRLLHRNQE